MAPLAEILSESWVWLTVFSGLAEGQSFPGGFGWGRLWLGRGPPNEIKMRISAIQFCTVGANYFEKQGLATSKKKGRVCESLILRPRD